MNLKITEMRNGKTNEYVFLNVGTLELKKTLSHYLGLHFNLTYMDMPPLRVREKMISHFCELMTTGFTEISGSQEVSAGLKIEITK